MKGQLSAEMLILIVVILAIVAIAATQLLGSARETSSNIGNQTDRLTQVTKTAVKSPLGGSCMDNEDCAEGTCIKNRCRA